MREGSSEEGVRVRIKLDLQITLRISRYSGIVRPLSGGFDLDILFWSICQAVIS